jgi:hypothetical protein
VGCLGTGGWGDGGDVVYGYEYERGLIGLFDGGRMYDWEGNGREYMGKTRPGRVITRYGWAGYLGPGQREEGFIVYRQPPEAPCVREGV